MLGDVMRETEMEDFGVLRNVAEDLKTPFLRIVSQLQLNRLEGHNNTQDTEVIAEAALRLLDSYIVSTQIYTGQQQLELEPISMHAVMNNCSHYLRDLARLQGYETEFRVQKGIGLVMANSPAINAAIMSLTYSFLYNSDSQTEFTDKRLIFMLRRSKQGIDAGLFSKEFHVSAKSLQKLRSLKGIARQLTPDFAHGSSAGIVIADQLFSAMDTELRPARFKRLSGLAVSMVPSRQLSLI